MSIRSKEIIYHLLPSSGIARFLLVKPSGDFGSPLHCNLHALPISPETNYDYLIPPIETRKKTRPFFLDGKNARMHFEIETCLRYMRHDTKEQMFWIRPLCIHDKTPSELEIHNQQRFSLINNANRVRAFMGKPYGHWNPDLVSKVLRAMHELVGDASGRQRHFDRAVAFNDYYEPIRLLLRQPDARTAVEQALDMLCNAIWRERWKHLQTAGVSKDIDLYAGSTPIPIGAFYTMASYLCQAQTFNSWPKGGPIGKDNTLHAACRIAQGRRQMLRLLKKWKSQMVENGPLPRGLEDELHIVFRPKGRVPTLKQRETRQELRLKREIQREIMKLTK